MSTTLKVINPTSLSPAGPFAHGFVIPAGHGLVITAGQVGTTDANGTIAETYEGQVKAAIANLATVLGEAGAGVRDIVKLTYYIVDYDVNNRLVHINALQSFLDGHKPATSLVGVASLANPKLLFEIEAIAAVKPASHL